jgi:hypothetical protein
VITELQQMIGPQKKTVDEQYTEGKTNILRGLIHRKEVLQERFWCEMHAVVAVPQLLTSQQLKVHATHNKNC